MINWKKGLSWRLIHLKHLLKKIIILIIGFVMMFSLVACSSKNNSTIPSTDDILSTIIPSDTTPSDNTFTDDYELMNKTIVFKIANTEVDVYWLDNNSVKELKKLAKDGLTINMQWKNNVGLMNGLVIDEWSARTSFISHYKAILNWKTSSVSHVVIATQRSIW